MNPFSTPNDSRKAPVNRMIHKLLALKAKALRGSKSMAQFTSHGNPIHISDDERERELRKYASIRVIEGLIAKLEQIVD